MTLIKVFLWVAVLPFMALAVLPSALLVGVVLGDVAFQWWMLVGVLPVLLLGYLGDRHKD